MTVALTEINHIIRAGPIARVEILNKLPTQHVHGVNHDRLEVPEDLIGKRLRKKLSLVAMQFFIDCRQYSPIPFRRDHR